MDNTLRIKVKIACNTCGCILNRTKSIKVSSCDKISAITEVQQKVDQWKKSFIGKNCKTCQSIVDSLK